MSNTDIITNFYSEHRDELIAFVNSRLHNIPEAEDIVQEVFMRLLTNSNPICENTVSALVYTLCRNMVVDWFRWHAIRKNARYEWQTIESSADASTLRRDIAEYVEHGLLRLPEECRDVYRLHIYDGMQAKDICLHTGWKYKAVEYRLGQARKEIRNYLKDIS